MPDNNPTPTQALRKRQQIENAGKKMFLWVAGAAALVGLCAVLSISLFERITFRQEIIGLKTTTVGNLQHNIKVASELKDQVRVLNTNKSLLATPRLVDSEPLSVILDALPASANSSALGASLQQKLLNEPGVTLEALTVKPIAGVEDQTDASSSGGDVADGEVGFQFSVSAPTGSADKLREVLRRLERSIRTINLTQVTVDQQGNKVVLTAEGKAYYKSATRVELKTESKRP